MLLLICVNRLLSSLMLNVWILNSLSEKIGCGVCIVYSLYVMKYVRFRISSMSMVVCCMLRLVSLLSDSEIVIMLIVSSR